MHDHCDRTPAPHQPQTSDWAAVPTNILYDTALDTPRGPLTSAAHHRQVLTAAHNVRVCDTSHTTHHHRYDQPY
jgi:hypothetical protein